MTEIIFTLATTSQFKDALGMLQSAEKFYEKCDLCIVALDWPHRIKKEIEHPQIQLISLSDIFSDESWIDQAFYLSESQFKWFVRPYVFEYLSKQKYTSSLYLGPHYRFLKNPFILREKVASSRAVVLSQIVSGMECCEPNARLQDEFLYLKLDKDVSSFISVWQESASVYENHGTEEMGDLTLFQSLPVYVAGTQIIHDYELCCNKTNWQPKFKRDQIELFEFHDNSTGRYPFSHYENGRKIPDRHKRVYRSLHKCLKSEIGNPFLNESKINSFSEKGCVIHQEALLALSEVELKQFMNNALLASATFRTGEFVLKPIKFLLKCYKKLKFYLGEMRSA